jgi:hypothetical protein
MSIATQNQKRIKGQRLLALYILLHVNLSSAAFDEDWPRVAVLARRLQRVRAFLRAFHGEDMGL